MNADVGIPFLIACVVWAQPDSRGGFHPSFTGNPPLEPWGTFRACTLCSAPIWGRTYQSTFTPHGLGGPSAS